MRSATQLVLNMLAEVTATNIFEIRNPEGFVASAEIAKEGAETAKVARQKMEKSMGMPATSRLNAKNLRHSRHPPPDASGKVLE